MDWAQIKLSRHKSSLLESRRYELLSSRYKRHHIQTLSLGPSRFAVMYVSSPPFSGLILCPDHTSFPAPRIALHVLTPSQFYSPVLRACLLSVFMFPHGIWTESFSRGQSRKSASVTTETHSHKCSSLDADSKPPVVEWLGGNVLTTYLCIEFVTQQCLFKTASWELSGPG